MCENDFGYCSFMSLKGWTTRLSFLSSRANGSTSFGQIELTEMQIMYSPVTLLSSSRSLGLSARKTISYIVISAYCRLLRLDPSEK